jgi:hypothetical protein
MTENSYEVAEENVRWIVGGKMRLNSRPRGYNGTQPAFADFNGMDRSRS